MWNEIQYKIENYCAINDPKYYTLYSMHSIIKYLLNIYIYIKSMQ